MEEVFVSYLSILGLHGGTIVARDEMMFYQTKKNLPEHVKYFEMFYNKIIEIKLCKTAFFFPGLYITFKDDKNYTVKYKFLIFKREKLLNILRNKDIEIVEG